MGFAKIAPVAYFAEDNYFSRLVGLDYDSEGEFVVLGEDFPVRLMPRVPEAGHTWTQSTRMFTTPEGGGGRLGWDGRVRYVESMTVPAGTFSNVLEIETVYIDQSEAEATPQVVYHDYYAKGVGLIRSLTDDPESNEENHMEQVLLEYDFPR